MSRPPFATDWAQLFLAPLWGIVVVFILLGVLWLFRRPVTRVLADLGISRLSVLGVDIEWIVDQTSDAYRRHDLQPPGRAELEAFATLSTRLAPLVRGKRVLWVDDVPAGNEVETRLLRRLGIEVDVSRTTTDALARLGNERARFELVISDWVRNGETDAALDLLRGIRSAAIDLPVIVYVGRDTPERRARAAEYGALTLATEPDDLLKFALVELAAAG